MTYAIVAIPSKDDPVWKISSEKIPHLTILMLDDTLPNLSHTIDFIQHVVDTSLCRFGMSVDHRDVLGPKEADVLFFGSYGVKCLEEFRANLLKNSDIFVAYNSTEQFPKWVPHLTLGYPETPAKPDAREYPISWVNFDRIALWTSDYEGPEFLLKENQLSEVGMSSMKELQFQTPEEALAHFGIKGMRWGHHKAEAAARAALPVSKNYGVRNYSYDRQKFGQKGADRINEHMHNGMDYRTARKTEQRRQIKKRLIIAGSAYAAAMLVTHGPTLAQNLANGYVGKKNAAAASRAAANLLADSRGIGNHKIVDLGFNAATGVWG